MPSQRLFILSLVIFLSCTLLATGAPAQEVRPTPPDYLNLTQPRRVLPDGQEWEGKEFPHTMSVLEWNRGGFRYWGWYGLNEGKGIGLARSNDLLHWKKYKKNPLWQNARWPSVLEHANPSDTGLLYFAITRDYDTPSSHIVLASSRDGIHLEEVKILVPGVAKQRNQNPNLFFDPLSRRVYLTFYRGNDQDHFEIVSRNAMSVLDLDKAPEKVLLSSSETIAAPTILYLQKQGSTAGIYYLATEIYPHRYTSDPSGEWQVKVFAAPAPDGDFQPVAGNPVMKGQRACLFQHIFHGRFYGFDCHLETNDQWVLEEVEADLP